MSKENVFFDEKTKGSFKIIGYFLLAVLCYYITIWEIKNTILGYIPLIAEGVIGIIFVCIPIIPLALIAIVLQSFLHVFKKIKWLIKK